MKKLSKLLPPIKLNSVSHRNKTSNFRPRYLRWQVYPRKEGRGPVLAKDLRKPFPAHYEAATDLRLKPVTDSTRIQPNSSHKYKHKIPWTGQGQRDGSAGKGSRHSSLAEFNPCDPGKDWWKGLTPQSCPHLCMCSVACAPPPQYIYHIICI